MLLRPRTYGYAILYAQDAGRIGTGTEAQGPQGPGTTQSTGGYEKSKFKVGEVLVRKPEHRNENWRNRFKELPEPKAPDAVNSPQHYQFFRDLEAIEVIARSKTQEQFYGYCLGNRLKYRLRAGNKDKLEQDIAKSDKYSELYEQHRGKCIDAK
ncbi:endonuclease [Klebsiella virus 2019KP1]|nr:endonuclease [Klebsiella virus 2019KP1]